MRTLIHKLADSSRAVEDRLTVRAHITIAFAAMIVVLVGALAAGAALVSYRNTSELVNTRLAAVASITAERLDRYMAIRQQEVHLFSKLEPLRGLWQGDRPSLRKALEQLQSSYSDFAWIGFAKPDGTVVAATGGMLEGASVAQRPWFRTGLHDVIVGDVHEAALLSSLLAKRADGEPHRFVDIALPVRDAEGTLLGVLGAHLDWQWAQNIIARTEATDEDADTTLMVMSKSGKVLVGAGMNSTRYAGERLATMLETRSGAFTEKVGEQNKLIAYVVGRGHREYQGLNWIVTASQPTAVALSAAAESAKNILLIGAGIGVLGIALAFLIARRISHPIHAITLEADRIGRASGPSMLPRQRGSLEVVQLTQALRSLLRRIGFAEERTKEAELRATENALQFKDDLSKLRRLADTDYLTELMNRRSFLAAANDAVEFALRYRRNIATLMIDIDHFKKINDTHGHHIGDIAIKTIAEIISNNIKSTDRAARFGGEEFVVLLREADEQTAQALGERIRRAVELAIIGEGETRLSATVSVGIALIADGDRDVQDMIERADQGLYVAKNTGRNRCFFMPASEDRGIRAA
ncbi:diguanylate cyclase [Tardiphaga alba]|uniref:diguanylate cyclase n=1 Tax=Tardiphaga alba TaxID=340268 RepID=A0ABX8A7Z1_9BRAD|nr:sensor domain-containing diguanylate cyclase [Tardiphaga alba]QUS38400.1 diguanylate cyclase [Tardiphaga alba]